MSSHKAFIVGGYSRETPFDSVVAFSSPTRLAFPHFVFSYPYSACFDDEKRALAEANGDVQTLFESVETSERYMPKVFRVVLHKEIIVTFKDPLEKAYASKKKLSPYFKRLSSSFSGSYEGSFEDKFVKVLVRKEDYLQNVLSCLI